MKPEDLADLIERLSWEAHRKPEQCSEIGMKTIHHNLPAILSALRRVEKLEAALELAANRLDRLTLDLPYGHQRGDAQDWTKEARQALTGEA